MMAELPWDNKRSTLQGPFWGVPSRSRLYSEIDHLHLSIEAQCVSHLLPLGDCHTFTFALLNVNNKLLSSVIGGGGGKKETMFLYRGEASLRRYEKPTMVFLVILL